MARTDLTHCGADVQLSCVVQMLYSSIYTTGNRPPWTPHNLPHLLKSRSKTHSAPSQTTTRISYNYERHTFPSTANERVRLNGQHEASYAFTELLLSHRETVFSIGLRCPSDNRMLSASGTACTSKSVFPMGGRFDGSSGSPVFRHR